MNTDELLKRVIRLTIDEEKWLRTIIKNGEDWQNYYKGEHTVIRRDKLALLTKDRETLRQLTTPNQPNLEEPLYCAKCGTKLRTMPCDEELTYCPSCDLDHEY